MADLAVMAQQYAVSHNVMTALVGVTNPSALPSAQYRAFIVLERDSSGNWNQVNKWTMLPDAVVMSSASINTFLTFQGSYAQTFPSLTLNGTSVSANNLAYQLFLPDGRMDTSAASIVLPIVSDQPVANQAAVNPQNYYELIFNPNTGTVKINRP